MSFSSFDRFSTLNKLHEESFDLLIIGGGITGAGIALDAALRGLKTALVEKNDFAYGTSSRSTKLIHGGLRYLKQLEFGLVKEVGSERAIVHTLAPHLVIAEKMLLPLNHKRGFGSVLTSIGLRLYDWLAGVRPEDQRKMLTRNQTLKAEPLLNPEDIKGGGLYAEYRTDDARLTIEIVKTAASNGAVVSNYCEVTGLEYQNGLISGASLRDVISEKHFQVMTGMIVNATGPWVDTLREKDNSKRGKKLHLTKGVHIVVSHSRFPVMQAIYFSAPDERMIFAIPRGDKTYIGTTDTDYYDSLDDVRTSISDATYLLDAVNDAFPAARLTLDDIESSWAGLRPLIHEEGRSASELSRKDEIFESPSGLISIAGGKLTGYRKMAERVVDLVIKKKFAKRNLKTCHTHRVKLMGSPFHNDKEVNAFKNDLKKKLTIFGLENYTDYLVHNYGDQTLLILDRVDKTSNDADLNLVKAELWFTVHHEMVISPLDFFIRRTGMMFFDMDRLLKVMEPILEEFKNYFKWDEAGMKLERSRLEKAIHEATLGNYSRAVGNDQ